MIIKIQLKLGAVHICDICGASINTPVAEAVERFTAKHSVDWVGHVSNGMYIGKRVRIRVPNPKNNSLVHEQWEVTNLFFASGGPLDFPLRRFPAPNLHELCVSLRHLRRKTRSVLDLPYRILVILRGSDEDQIANAWGLGKSR